MLRSSSMSAWFALRASAENRAAGLASYVQLPLGRVLYSRRAQADLRSSSTLMRSIARDGLSFLGQTSVQFMIVRQR